jgi:phosphopantetheinyl transferase
MMRIIKSDDTQLYFYKYRTQKEAVIKACGLQSGHPKWPYCRVSVKISLSPL